MRSARWIVTFAAVAFVVAGCASAGQRVTAPDFVPPAGSPAPAHAAIYAACIAEAIGAHRLDLSADSSSRLLRFSCAGAPALAFYEALAGWSADKGTQWRREGRSWRATLKVRRDLFGVDYCSVAERDGDAHCVITLNVGGFLVAP